MFRCFPLLVVATLLLTPISNSFAQSSQSGTGKTIIILDASGSMWGQIEGRPKIEIAREVIGELLQDLDPGFELGLMAYGHREKGNCDDIELLLPPGKVDREAFRSKVMSIIPKGKTPLTDAVEQAAGYLQIEENAANVILVSDGLETCDRDPCALAGQLAAKGVAFRTHIVAFDLSAEDSKTFRCLADETGGAFLQAQDAATLKDALEIAVEAVSAPQETEMPKPKLDPATISAPGSVPAGSRFEITWEGPDNKGDYLTIVPKGAKEGDDGNYVYTRQGSPCELTAPIREGACEIRYRASSTGDILGRTDILVTPVEATLSAPAEVTAGSGFEVKWEGPDNKGDYITIVVKGAEEEKYNSYAYTRNGNPASIRALSDAGEAELRYVTGQGGITLARLPIKIKEADVVVSGPEVADAGGPIEISWKGPNNKGDYITITKREDPEGTYNAYTYTAQAKGETLTVTAVEEAGDDYELRYVEGQDGKTLASAPIVLRPVSASVSGPEAVVAGSDVEVEWFGPKFKSYYVTVVMAGEAEGKYGKYFYTSNEESPTKVAAPEEVGDAEIRFVTAKGKTLASVPIQLTAASATITESPEQVAAGEAFRVKWEGPNNKGDYVTIVKPDAEDKAYGSYIYVQNGMDRDIKAPEEGGDYELRYVTAGKKAVLTRKPIKVVSE